MLSPLLLLLFLCSIAGARYARFRVARQERDTAYAVLSGAPPPVREPLRFRWRMWWEQLEHSRRHPALREVARAVYILERVIMDGARPLALHGSESLGEVHVDGIDIRFGGACPVQGDGAVDGRACYYRSRGEGWSMGIGKDGSADSVDMDAWTYVERPYIWPEGGYVPAAVSIECILRAVAKWRSEGRP